jgi:ribosome-associated heat shock protein Hsp15
LAGVSARPSPEAQPKQRLDIWLCNARFFKSRSLAAETVSAGHCRVNGQRQSKPGHAIAPGDVLTFPQGNRIRLIRVQALGDKRGPFSTAQGLYADMDATPSPLE